MKHAHSSWAAMVVLCGQLICSSAFANETNYRFIDPARNAHACGDAFHAVFTWGFVPRLERLSWLSRADGPAHVLGEMYERLHEGISSGRAWIRETSSGADIGLVDHTGATHRLLIRSTSLEEWIRLAHGDLVGDSFGGQLRTIADAALRGSVTPTLLHESSPAAGDAVRVSAGYMSPTPGKCQWFDMLEAPASPFKLIINAQNFGALIGGVHIGTIDARSREVSVEGLTLLARAAELRPQRVTLYASHPGGDEPLAGVMLDAEPVLETAMPSADAPHAIFDGIRREPSGDRQRLQATSGALSLKTESATAGRICPLSAGPYLPSQGAESSEFA